MVLMYSVAVGGRLAAYCMTWSRERRAKTGKARWTKFTQGAAVYEIKSIGIAPPAATKWYQLLQKPRIRARGGLPAGAKYHGYSAAANAGATTRHDTPKRKIEVSRSIPRNIVGPVPP